MCAIQIQSVIETPRLRLRAPQLSDAGIIAKLLNDHEVARMTTSIPHPYGVEDAQAFLSGMDDKSYVIDHPRYGPIGSVGFSPGENGQTEIGYWLGKPYWGSGFATEAARAALPHADRRHVMARHFADNPASGEVLIKAGFLYTGDVSLTPSVARSGVVPSRWMVWLA